MAALVCGGMASQQAGRSLPSLLPQPQNINLFDGPPLQVNGAALCIYRPEEAERLEDPSSRFYRNVRRASPKDVDMFFAGHDVGNPLASECSEQEDKFIVRLKILDVRNRNSKTQAKLLLSKESYHLTARNESISIASYYEEGLFRGYQTLLQLLQISGWDGSSQTWNGSRIDQMEIIDWPSLPNRGVMLDVSRNRIHTLETFMGIVDVLAKLKINQLQLYTEHTFAFQNHSRVWKGTGALEAPEVLALSEYAHDRYIKLVPNQQSFGHMQHWLKHEDYLHLAEHASGSNRLWTFEYCCSMFSDRENLPYSLAPDSKSVEFLDSLYSELLQAFPYSDNINIGFDETYDLGMGKSKQAVAHRGQHYVYLKFLEDVVGVLNKYNRSAMFWGDIIAEHWDALSRLPNTSIVLDWGYEARAPFRSRGARFQQHGVKFYVCPGTSSWLSIGGRMENMMVNVLNAATAGSMHSAEGLLVTDWGDGGHMQPLAVSVPGYAAAAEYSWNMNLERSFTVEGLTEHLMGKVSKFVLNAGSGVIGRVLILLGNLYKIVGSQTLANRSALFDILILSNLKTALVNHVIVGLHITRSGLQQALGNLKEASMLLIGELAKFDVEGADQGPLNMPLSIRELMWAVSFLTLSCQVGLECVELGDARCDLSKIPRARAEQLGMETQRLRERLQVIWPARSREGAGLDDTLLRLQHVENVLKAGRSTAGRPAQEGGQRAGLLSFLSRFMQKKEAREESARGEL
uniref:beta-N-acetylhexosaminidase n=1 Tax=Hanusia phi TaxID=3032 RepID=A0A7S0H8V9_9CRYP